MSSFCVDLLKYNRNITNNSVLHQAIYQSFSNVDSELIPFILLSPSISCLLFVLDEHTGNSLIFYGEDCLTGASGFLTFCSLLLRGTFVLLN